MSDFSEDGFESDGSWDLHSDSSGPQIDRYARVRKGRILRFCVATTSTGVRAGALAVGGCERTARKGRSVFQVLEKEPKEKAKERVAPTVEKGLSRLGAGGTALGPNPQGPAPRLTHHPRTPRRRHRPPLLMVGRRQRPRLRGRASLTPGGATTARRRSPPTL